MQIFISLAISEKPKSGIKQKNFDRLEGKDPFPGDRDVSF